MNREKEKAYLFKEVLGLENSPVGIKVVEKADFLQEKVRICKAIKDVAKEKKKIILAKENNACFGASWHLGFQKIDNPKTIEMIKKFVVEGEKLFSSYSALDNLLSQMGDIPDNSNKNFILQAWEDMDIQPELVIFLCNPEQACRILTLLTFIDGNMPKIKIGGPTCRMAVIYPLISGEANISFYDYTARKLCNLDKDKLLVSIPYKKIPLILESIDRCSAGKAKIEYPQEFRKFLQKRFNIKKRH